MKMCVDWWYLEYKVSSLGVFDFRSDIFFFFKNCVRK